MKEDILFSSGATLMKIRREPGLVGGWPVRSRPCGRDMNPLDYASARPRRMGWRPILLALLIAALLLAGGEMFRRTVWLRYTRYRQVQQQVQRRLAWQADCLTHADPPDQLVFAAGKALGKAIADEMGGKDNRQVTGSEEAWASIPLAWHQEITFRMRNAPNNGTGTVFLHERHTPGGPSRLIAVDVSGDAHAVIFRYSIIVPGRAQLNNRANVRIPILRKFVFDDLRLYAGQPDSADPAAFTIRCVRVSPQTGEVKMNEMLDGRLNGDGTLSLTPRRGYIPTSDWEIITPAGPPLTPWSSPLRKVYGGGPQTPPPSSSR